jgi:hypothetical protein
MGGLLLGLSVAGRLVGTTVVGASVDPGGKPLQGIPEIVHQSSDHNVKSQSLARFVCNCLCIRLGPSILSQPVHRSLRIFVQDQSPPIDPDHIQDQT